MPGYRTFETARVTLRSGVQLTAHGRSDEIEQVREQWVRATTNRERREVVAVLSDLSVDLREVVAIYRP